LNAAKAKYENGQVILTEPVDWPEGVDVIVEPMPQATLGIPEDQWPTDLQGIAELLARMDKATHRWLSPEDEAGWEAGLQAQKEYEKARFQEHGEELRRMWE
jgi:hypothetical protein